MLLIASSWPSKVLSFHSTASALRRSNNNIIRLFSSSVKKVVFLGTPECAVESLELLYQASKASVDESKFEISAVVTQPPAPAGRKKILTPSPVHIFTESHPDIQLFYPEKAKDVDFLASLKEMQPDLCITAAYGNFLPTKFLEIPKFGTINIHPSLLPKYRGAAPVQRCLENGDAESGVSVVFTVLKMDAGPIIRQEVVKLNGNEKADSFLSDMFKKGTEVLIETLPSVWDGSVEVTEQDDDDATPANKLSQEDSRVDLATMSASEIHNKCRGYAIWPGIWTTLKVGEEEEPKKVKIISTRLLESSSEKTQVVKELKEGKKSILKLVCEDGSVLGVTQLQIPGKNVVDAKSFINGLRGQSLSWTSPP